MSHDDANPFTVRADVAQVKAGRDEFLLLFGAARREQPNRDELRVDLLERVVLSPFAAKRLLGQLHRMIRDYDSEVGLVEQAVLIRERLLPTPPLKPPSFGSEEATKKVEVCFRLLMS